MFLAKAALAVGGGGAASNVVSSAGAADFEGATAAAMQRPVLGGVGSPLPHLAASSCVYMDWNATTPIFPEVASEMEPFLHTHFGNPSSGHALALPCGAAVQLARERVAMAINASPSTIHFTSCGTESDNWAICGTVAAARLQEGADFLPHVVTTAIEHPAVLECLAALQRQGLATHTVVGASPEGLVDPAEIAAAIQPDTVLVTVMHANNEVGSLLAVKEIAAMAHELGVLVHCDAAQSLGKVPVDVQELGVDMLTIVGHKFGAPKGVAALYVSSDMQLERLLHGGGQEGGRRAGTESVLLLAGLGKAAELIYQELEATAAHMAAMRDHLQQLLLQGLAQQQLAVRVNGPCDPAKRLPNTLSISIRGMQASQLLSDLSAELAASAGSACHSSSGPSISPVLQAMQVPAEFAVGTLRLSTGRHTTKQDVEAAAKLILGWVQRQEEAAGRPASWFSRQ